jgi:hypothetical protein
MDLSCSNAKALPRSSSPLVTCSKPRSSVETTFSMIEAKFGDSLRSKSDVGHINEVLCKVVARNLCMLIACIHELGLEAPAFSHAS